MNRPRTLAAPLINSTFSLWSFVFIASSLLANPLPEPLLIDKGKALTVSDQIDRKAYPNADSVLVNDFEKIVYRADGTADQWDEVYVKILTEKGKRDNQTLSLYFTIPYSSVEIPLLEVINPDGKTRKIKVEEQSRVMIDRSQMSSNIYNPNRKIFQIGVPGLEPGDLLHYIVLRRIQKTRVPDSWSDYSVLEYTTPIKRYVIEITGPKSLPLRNVKLKDEVEGTISYSKREAGDEIVHRWEVNDVPRMYEEPNMPALHTVVQRLLVSTIADWSDISKWYSDLCAPHLEKTTPAMKREVERLMTDADDREEGMKAIFRYVSQNIRYMGITTEIVAPGYEPHDVSVTFENKYGVCRDKAALLVAMLRLAGFDAHPVLIHNGPKKDEEVPQPYFNHAIVCVIKDDGSHVLMDPTDENTQKLFPAYLCNQSYLVAKPEGDSLRVSPTLPAKDNLILIETRGKLTSDGGLRAKTAMTFEGINDNAYRGHFARLKPGEVKQFFERKLRGFLSGANVISFAITPQNLTDVSKPLRAEIEFETDNFIIKGNSETLVNPPWFGASFGIVNYVLGKTGLKTRTYPLKTDVPCGVAETFTLDLGGAVGPLVSSPKPVSVVDENIHWSRSLAVKKNSLVGDNKFLIKREEFTPRQYGELKESLIKIERGRRQNPVFKSVTPPPLEKSAGDAVTSSWRTDILLEDDQTWVVVERVKREILTYAGKKTHAELKVNYNPAWETLKLVEATVTSPSGERQTVGDQEINVMDASWVGSAPRYPAEKTLVASFPNVEIGSELEYEIRRELRDHPFFSFMTRFQGSNQITSRTVTLSIPKTTKIKLRPPASKNVALDLSETGGRIVHTWTATNQPAIVSEHDTPPPWTFTPCLLISNGDWYNYSQELKAFLSTAAMNQRRAAAVTKKLISTAANTADKIRLIRDYVAKNVRLAGPDLNELPLSLVTPADKTLKDGYGNTTDRAVLIHSMLRSVGIDSEFMLASSYPNIPILVDPLTETPQLFLYNQVLVKCSLGSTPVYLNDANQYAKLGSTAHSGHPSLSLETGLTEEIAPKTNMRDKIETSFNIKMDADGDAVLTRHDTYYGIPYAEFHELFSEMPPEKRDRYFQEAVGDVSLAAEPVGDLTTNFNIYPGVEEFTVAADRYAVRDGNFLYFTLPESPLRFVTVSGEKRVNPYYLRNSTRLTFNYFISLPPNVDSIQTMPSPLEWTGPGESGSITITAELISRGVYDRAPAVIKVTADIDLKPSIIPADGFDDLIEIQKRVSAPTMSAIFITIPSKPKKE